VAPKIELPPEILKRRKISVPAAAKLNDLSARTFRRKYRHLIKQVSERRQAVDLDDALAIGEPKTAA
jgi:hypothetical protein